MKAPRDQHFLVSKKVVDRIAGFAKDAGIANRRVLEIGPGKGILTQALLERDANVVAIELDKNLVTFLKERFKKAITAGRLELIEGNAVRCEYPEFDLVVANLPYSASSKITFRLLEHGFETAILMYQKEFAQRMIARPGTSACGRLSIMVQTYARAKPLMEIAPKHFDPPPEVYSWVMKITPHNPPYPINDHDFYAAVVRELFSHRRKTIRKALKSGSTALGPERTARMLELLPEELLKRRAEELSLQEFALVANTGSSP